MKTLTKFMRNMGILVIVLLAVTIFNPLVVTKSNEYSLIIQFGKVVRVENSAVHPSGFPSCSPCRRYLSIR